jgi:molybdopterin-guanine dinucleotide biosynthesis protein A
VNVTGIVLAGGKGSRMGGVDKGLQQLRGKPMIDWVLARFAPQVAEIVINANQNVATYAQYGPGGFGKGSPASVRVAAPEAGFAGVLCPRMGGSARIWLLDSMFLKKRSGGKDGISRIRCSLMKREGRESLEAFLASGGRKIDAWYAALRVVEVGFDDEADAFRNINTLEELKGA